MKTIIFATAFSILLGIGAVEARASAQVLMSLVAPNPSVNTTVDIHDPRWGILAELAGHEFLSSGPTSGSMPDTWTYKFTVNPDGSIRTNIGGWHIFDTFVGEERTYANRKLVHESLVYTNGLYVMMKRGNHTIEYAIIHDQDDKLRLIYKDRKYDAMSFAIILVDRTQQDAKILFRASHVKGSQAIEQAIGGPLDDLKSIVKNGVGNSARDQSPMFAAGTRQMDLALTNRDAPAAVALLPKLEAVASSEGDRFRLGTYMTNVAALTSDDATALRGLTLMAGSGKIPLKDMPSFYGRRGTLLATIGQYREADSDLRTAIEMGVKTEAIFRTASDVKDKLGDAPAARQFASRADDLESSRLLEARRLALLKQDEMNRKVAAQRQREQGQRLAAQAPKRGGGLFGKIMAATGGALAMAGGGGGAGDILGGAIAASNMVNDSGNWAPASGPVNPLLGNSATGNVNPLISGAGGASSGVTGVSASADFPVKPSALGGSDACSMMNEDNYRQVALSGGNDIQLKTMCGQAFEFYSMYKKAIDQGYSE